MIILGVHLVYIFLAISLLDIQVLAVGIRRKHARYSDKCTGFNEMYSECGGECETYCVDLIYPKQHMQCVPERCTEGCICKRGTARNEQGTCVRLKVCLAELFAKKDFPSEDYADRDEDEDEDLMDDDGTVMFLECKTENSGECRRRKATKIQTEEENEEFEKTHNQDYASSDRNYFSEELSDVMEEYDDDSEEEPTKTSGWKIPKPQRPYRMPISGGEESSNEGSLKTYWPPSQARKWEDQQPKSDTKKKQRQRNIWKLDTLEAKNSKGLGREHRLKSFTNHDRS